MSGESPKPSGQAPIIEHRHPGVTYSREEKAHQREVVRTLLSTPLGTPESVERQLRGGIPSMSMPPLGKRRAMRVVNEVLEGWSKGIDPRQRERNRGRAAARIRRHLEVARGKPNMVSDPQRPGQLVQRGWIKGHRPNFAAIARLEFLLMRIEGTEQPHQVDHNVEISTNAIEAITKLGADQVGAIMARRAETQRLADLARKRLPEAVLDAEYEVVPG